LNSFHSLKQLADAEKNEKSRQDANKTAFEAIGSRKKRKIDEHSSQSAVPSKVVS
jgi:hypothetical protein